MPRSCCVVGCANRRLKGAGLKFALFPTVEPKRRAWKNAIRRLDPDTGKSWEPGKYSYVCFAHFHTGKTTTDKNHPDYVPSLNLGYGNKNLPAKVDETTSRRIDRYERALRRAEIEDAKSEDDHESSESESEDEEIIPVIEDVYRCVPEETGERDLVDSGGISVDDLMEQLAHLREENRTLKSQLMASQSENKSLRARVEDYECNRLIGEKFLASGKKDIRTRFYTGLPNHACFQWLSKYCESIPSHSPEKLMIVLVKLRLNLRHHDLATRFGISKSSVSRIINDILPNLAAQLQLLVHWPEKTDIKRTLPRYHHNHHHMSLSSLSSTTFQEDWLSDAAYNGWIKNS